ncbi:MAG: sulfide/dihydroorotate dehydrogenase-like FAD/NAD-binding protein [Planctomycetota bacterium]|nr:MAG: sulfide/dihydroorotate dehydrogenase-like FAD/NAD-binding protein [Planctomycetota bacterium]
MHEITYREVITPDVFLLKIKAPVIARKRKAGQFVIYRLHEKSERIPLTLADADPDEGTITLLFQAVGKSTMELGTKKAGDQILDVVGPLGKPTHLENFGTVVCIGGGIGVAPLYPIVQAMKDAGNNVVTIIGARTKDLLILEDMVKAASSELHICTDDGSYCEKGFVTDRLKHLVEQGVKPDLCVAIGPVVMMRAVCNMTREFNIPTVVSLNPIMVDGTGMCGACRVTVGGKTKFACVDGPEFDGHQVDFDELIKRQAAYLAEEKTAREKWTCESGQ